MAQGLQSLQHTHNAVCCLDENTAKGDRFTSMMTISSLKHMHSKRDWKSCCPDWDIIIWLFRTVSASLPRHHSSLWSTLRNTPFLGAGLRRLRWTYQQDVSDFCMLLQSCVAFQQYQRDLRKPISSDKVKDCPWFLVHSSSKMTYRFERVCEPQPVFGIIDR